MTDLQALRTRLHNPDYGFAETLAFIGNHYHYRPTSFSNGSLQNPSGQNEGACRLIGLALLEGLSLEETLLAFGEHYRNVVDNPFGSDHANIRALLKSGLGGVRFDKLPLLCRSN